MFNPHVSWNDTIFDGSPVFVQVQLTVWPSGLELPPPWDPSLRCCLVQKNDDDDDDDVYEYDDEASEDEGKRVLNHQLCSTAK